MGVIREVLKEGNGADKPKGGDMVGLEYIGYLYNGNRGDINYQGKQ